MAAGSAIELGELMKEIEELKKQVNINVIRCGHCEYKHRSKSKIKEHIRLYHNNVWLCYQYGWNRRKTSRHPAMV